MADYPIPELGGKTPLQAADTPNMDRIAACRIGLARTIPAGMEPGSDVANLSLLGYDPEKYHTGRAPLEAAGMGVELEMDQVAFRMNLVTLGQVSDDEIIMVSHSSGDITTGEAAKVVKDIERGITIAGINIYPGVAYRHLLVWKDGPVHAETIPPHDVLNRNMAGYLNNTADNPISSIICSSWEVLREHPVNLERRRSGLKEANSIWLWGQGKAPEIPPFNEKYGLEGGVISAVDLLKGIGIYAGLRPIYVEGATGYIDTNYIGKAEGALNGLNDLDFVFLHVEAPDEAGHNGDFKEKVEGIEYFDQKVVGTVLEGLKEFGDYRIMVVSDHFTPVSRMTHTDEPTPFAWAEKSEIESMPEGPQFTEEAAEMSGVFFNKGHGLISSFLNDF